MKPPPSLPQLRQDLKAALAAERDQGRRSAIGRALREIERAESKSMKPTENVC